MDGLAIVAGASERQPLPTQVGAGLIADVGLKWLGGRSKVKRASDVTGGGHKLAGGVDDGDGSIVDRFHQARTDLLRQHRRLRGAKGWVAQVVLVAVDDLGMELIKNRLHTLAHR